TILNLTAYRDLGGFWNAAPDLFDEATNSQLVQANSNLSTLFSGQDFGQDVLTTVKPEWQLVVTRQEFRDGPDSPQIKLPAGALVFQLREPEKMRRSWKITFQSLIGFLNIVGAMERRPPLEIDSTTRGAAQMVTTSYAPPSDEGVLRPGAIYYNFSPTMATVGDRLILSSTRTLAEQLLDAKPTDAATGTNGAAGASGAKDDANGAAVVNGRLSFDFKSIRSALNDNRQQLVSQNMLDKGHGREQAEREIGLLLNALGLIRSAALQIDSNESRVQAELSLGLARPGE
ncbi:MAG TPA: hypothetical protein PLV92_17820, partial [Pirellulaceae bacterium]|nr:hypothetical protein [Pirellulaceae bacterium]